MKGYTSPTLSKRQFWGHWRWVHIRHCQNGHEIHVLGNDTRLKPSLPPGAIYCPQCENAGIKAQVNLGIRSQS